MESERAARELQRCLDREIDELSLAGWWLGPRGASLESLYKAHNIYIYTYNNIYNGFYRTILHSKLLLAKLCESGCPGITWPPAKNTLRCRAEIHLSYGRM